MNRLFSIILPVAALILPASDLFGQTCRIKASDNVAGAQVYREVYEYDFVTEKPSFPGGDREFLSYVNESRNYPRDAYNKGIQGKVTCSFVVNCDGTISHVSVLRGVEITLNKEAVRIISEMPDWIPGRHEGRPVPVRVVRTVAFRR